jgi:predicted flap endonuclease-1-like 5' DNA nuclease
VKNPPILIAVIGFFAALAGFGFLFFGLRVLGFDWFGAFGDLPKIENVGLWGWLAVATGIVWLAVAFGLWSLRPFARLFAQIVAGIGLLQAVIAFFQFPGTGYAFGMGLMPLLILWYLGTDEVKEAFGIGAKPAGALDATPVGAPVAVAATAAVTHDEPAAPAAAPVAAAAFVATTPAREPDAPPAAPVAAAAVAASTVSDEPAAPAAAPVAAAAAPEPEPAPAAPAPAPAADAERRSGIQDVEGIGPAEAEKLAAAGITTTAGLLEAGAKPDGRERIAAASGISSKLILEWVNHVDLMRIRGVGSEYSDLLEAAGVDSPAELAHRNPANLAVTIQEVVAARPDIVRRVPTESEIAGWIQEAGTLDKVVEH